MGERTEDVVISIKGCERRRRLAPRSIRWLATVSV